MKTSDDDDDDDSIKDEEVRRDIPILSARLYDLKERFMKIVHKINCDATNFDGQISDEEDTSDADSDDDVSTAQRDSTLSSSDENDKENHSTDSASGLRDEKETIEVILQRKTHRHEYLKHIVHYPKIMKHITDKDATHANIPLRHLEPFIREHVSKNPTGKIYDQVTEQIQSIRRRYLKHGQ